MRRHIWLGIATGATLALTAHTLLGILIRAVLRHADAAELHHWSANAIDREIHEFLTDLNGQQS